MDTCLTQLITFLRLNSRFFNGDTNEHICIPRHANVYRLRAGESLWEESMDSLGEALVPSNLDLRGVIIFVTVMIHGASRNKCIRAIVLSRELSPRF